MPDELPNRENWSLDPKFDSSGDFYAALRAGEGERHEIAAVCSPMIYTDIEDKIEQIRARLLALEHTLDIFMREYVFLSQKDQRKWQKKVNRQKFPKRS